MAIGTIADGESGSSVRTKLNDVIAVIQKTAGSIVFIDSDGQLDEDNAKLFWDTVTERLGIGMNIPSFTVDISQDLVGSAVGLRVTNTNSAGSANFFIENELGNRMNQFMDGSTLAAGNIFGILRRDVGGLVSTGAVGSTMLLGTLGNFDVVIGTNNTARMTILKSGNIGINTIIPAALLDIAESGNQSSLYLTTNSTNNNQRSLFRFRKSGNNTIGAYGVTVNNERLGLIDWSGVGSNVDSFDQAAYINVIQDGSAGTTAVPVEMNFGTSPGGTTGATLRLTIKPDGKVSIGNITPTALLDIDSDIVRLRDSKTPASSGATGNQGDIAWDTNYIYVCTATNTWKRTAISTW